MTTTSEVSRGRPCDEDVAGLVKQFLAMRPGQSLFIEGVARAELEFLRAPVHRAGADIEIRWVEQDVKHGMAGCRVWRRAGEYDEL